MAVVLVEGFDAYNGVNNTLTSVGLYSRWANIAGSPVSLVAGRFGGQAFAAPTGSFENPIGIAVPTTSNSGTFGCAMYFGSTPGTKTHVNFGTASGNSARQFSIATNNGYFIIGTGTNTYPNIIVFTCPVPVPVAQWFYFELEFVISDTVGEIRMYFDGALVGSATGLDTRTSTTTSSWGYLQVGTDGGVSTARYFDDLYVTDTATRLGEQRVVTVVPTSDGTPSQWAASGGAVAPYTMVDEVLCNGDTDYIYDGTLGDRAVFNMASTGATPVSVSAVQIGTFSRKTDTGYRAIQLQYVDGGGTAYSSSDITLGTVYNRQVNLLGTNPATSTAWTPSEANALKTGVRISV